MGWDITFRHTDIEGIAEISFDSDCKSATVTLAIDWKDGWNIPLTRHELDHTAFHELMHLRLADLKWLAKSRFVTPDEINRAGEEAVTAVDNFYRSITGRG